MYQIYNFYADGTFNRFVKRLQPGQEHSDADRQKFRVYMAFLGTVMVLGWSSSYYRRLRPQPEPQPIIVQQGSSDQDLRIRIMQLEVEKLRLEVEV